VLDLIALILPARDALGRFHYGNDMGQDGLQTL